MKNLIIGTIIGTILAFCVPLRSLAQADNSIPVLQMYVLSEAGKMISNQASVEAVLDVAYSAPFCVHLTPGEIDKKFWQAVGLHAFSFLVINNSLEELEVAYNVQPNTFLPDDAHKWWSSAADYSYKVLINKGKDWADSFTFDTCMYLINHYTTYGKIPVPDGDDFMPLINPL